MIESLEGQASGAKSGTSVLMGTNLAINLLLSGSLVVLWGLINTLQVVAHFPLLVVNVPMNAKVYNDMLLDLATFNFIPKEQINEKVREVLGLDGEDEQEDGEEETEENEARRLWLRRKLNLEEAE